MEGQPRVGARVGRYEELVELASGGMATVYLAIGVEGEGEGELVAIKRPHRHLLSDKNFIAMLLDEAKVASRLAHPSVVRVRELGFEAEEPFLVLDYVEGASLSDLRKQLAAAERAVDTRVAVRIALDALEGLHAAHELTDENGKPLGLIHRDVSPHNVLLRRDGRALLTDFGIAKAEDRVQTTRTDEVKGKLAYLAPERIDRRRLCTKQSDVFAMGVVLWECLAGRRLFRGEEALETLQEVAHMPIPRLRRIGADVPSGLDDAIARALSRDLDERFKTAAELAEALRRGAGPAYVGSHDDVARVLEAVFAPRLQQRHDVLRTVLGGARADRALVASGLTPRPRAPADLEPGSAVLAAIAPPAPSERYVFDQLPSAPPPPKETRRRSWPLLGGAIASVVAATVALMVLSHTARSVADGPPPSSADPQAAPYASQSTPAATARRVVVPLPFVATHVTFDDEERDVDPAADVAAFDVRPESGTRHRVVATDHDGARAEGMVRENDGVARAESPGFYFTAPDVPDVKVGPAPKPRTSPRPTKRRGPAPVSTTSDGFSKVR